MAQSILEKSLIPIEYFYEGEEMTILGGETVPDFYPAICRIQALGVSTMPDPYPKWSIPVHHPTFDFAPLEPIAGTYNSAANIFQHPFLRIVFRPTTYHFSQTIEIIRPVHLLGAGQYSTLGTVFKFPINKGGIIIHSIRGEQLTTYLLSDENGLVYDANGDAQWGITKVNAPSYLSNRLVNRQILGNMFTRSISEGGFEWTQKNFENTHGANSIIEGINLVGMIEYIDSNGLPNNNTFDIFPDMQIVCNPGGNDNNADIFKLFNPYENHNRTSNWEGTKPIPGVPTLEGITGMMALEMYDKGYSNISNASKAAHGITSFVRAAIRDCTIENFAGHGVYFFGNNYGGVATCSEIKNTLVLNCCGNGYHFYGQDTSNLSLMGIQAVNVEGWGIVYSVTNSGCTLISSVFHNCVKGNFLCPPQTYTNSFHVQDSSFAPRERSIAFKEITNKLDIRPLVLIGCHGEDSYYSKFIAKRPSELFMVIGPMPSNSELFDIVPFNGNSNEKAQLLDKICNCDVLNLSCLIMGELGSTNVVGSPIVIGSMPTVSANILPK